MNILITGGAGYIGSVLTPMLLEAGHRVKVIDSFLYGGNTLAPCCAHGTFRVARVDCRDLEAVRPHLKGIDVVIPLAGLVGVPLGNLNPVDAELLNLKAQVGLFTMLSPDQYVIMPTTESSYGSNAEVCTEETVLNPLSTYALHKVAVETALLGRGNACSLRLATVFGMSPRMRLDLLVNDFTYRALRDRAFVVFEGQYRRTCVHVRDVARAFVHALDRHLTGIYNVGACTMTKISLCEAIQKQVPGFTFVEAPIGVDPDQRDYVVSMEKLTATGYAPAWGLDAGIAELLKGYATITGHRHRNA